MNARKFSLALVLFIALPLLASPPIEVVIPAGTSVHFKLKQSINTANAKVGQRVPAQLTAPLVVGTKTVAADGAPATVKITTAEASGRVGGSAKIIFSLASVTLANGNTADVRTSSYVREGKAHAKHNAKYIVGGAVVGALAGQALGGDRNATAKGTAIGAGVGIGAAAATGKFDFEVKAGDRFSLKLKTPIKTLM
jgi:hypothetical protein